jgi:DNA-binding FadR family transcriptional regulator
VISKNGSDNGSIQGRLITEIRRRIIAGEIQPGVNISELALAEEFGVSPTASTTACSNWSSPRTATTPSV